MYEICVSNCPKLSNERAAFLPDHSFGSFGHFCGMMRQCAGCHWFTLFLDALSHTVPQSAPCKTIRIVRLFLLNCLVVIVVLPFKSCQTGLLFLLNRHGETVGEGAKGAV